MARSQRISHHILSSTRRNNLRRISETADDGHAGEVMLGVGGEGAGEEEGSGREGGAEGCEE